MKNKINNIQEEVWLINEKPVLTKKLFGERKEDFFSEFTSSDVYTDYAYAAYFIDKNNDYHNILGWTGSVREISFLGQTDQFQNFIKTKIPVGRKRLAYYFSLFCQSFDPTTNTLSIFKKKDDQDLITDELFKVTDGLVMWRHQMEELFQYAGFNKKEAKIMQKDYQQGLRKRTMKKLEEVKIESATLLEILRNRVPPMKASKLNYSTSEYFYKHFVDL